jgi:YidC/Oxa1 family membrane protein insertase
MKYVLRALPLVVLPFTINFPGAILCYWVSSNFISLLQVGILRIPAVRDYFKIEPLITHKNLPVKPKGFTEGLKDCKCKKIYISIISHWQCLIWGNPIFENTY